MRHANQEIEKIQKQLKLDVEKLEERIAPWGNRHHSGHGSGSSHESENSQGQNQQ